MLRSLHHEVIPLVAAFVGIHFALRIADEVVFALLKLQGINVELKSIFATFNVVITSFL